MGEKGGGNSKEWGGEQQQDQLGPLALLLPLSRTDLHVFLLPNLGSSLGAPGATADAQTPAGQRDRAGETFPQLPAAR